MASAKEGTIAPGLGFKLRAFVRKFFNLLPRTFLAVFLARLRGVARFFMRPASRFGLGLSLFAPRPGDQSISSAWLTSVLRKQGVIPEGVSVTSAEPTGLDGNRGLAGAISRILVTYSDLHCKAPASFILKMSHADFTRRIMLLNAGQTREASFYSSVFSSHPSLRDVVPKAYYTFASNLTAESVMLFQDIARDSNPAVGLNMVMGNQIWGVPPNLPISPLPDRIETLTHVFGYAAKIHASYWNDRNLISSWRHGELRGTNWFNGSGRAQWELAIERGRSSWELVKLKSNLHKPDSKLVLDTEFVAFVDRSYNESNWKSLKSDLRKRNFTLCHNDFHAANQFLVSSPSPSSPDFPYDFKLFDWSEYGPWNAPTDLAQTLISDLPPQLSKDHTIALLESWYKTLISLNPTIASSYSLLDAKREFVHGGIARWIWVFSVLGVFPLPEVAIAYFYNQLWEFVKSAQEGNWEELKDGEDVDGVEGGVRKFVRLGPVVCLL